MYLEPFVPQLQGFTNYGRNFAEVANASFKTCAGCAALCAINNRAVKARARAGKPAVSVLDSASFKKLPAKGN